MKFTYFGHACFAIETNGKHLLFDPFISGNPLVGDKTYGNSRNRKLTNLNAEAKKMIGSFARQALHSRKIAFTHPESNELLEFESKLPADIDALVQELKRC